MQRWVECGPGLIACCMHRLRLFHRFAERDSLLRAGDSGKCKHVSGIEHFIRRLAV